MGKVVVNLTAGAEDSERATIAFLVGTAAQSAGHEVLAFFTMEAVRLAFPDGPQTVAVQEGRPAFTELWEQFVAAGGVVYLCPFCVTSRELGDEPLPGATVAGATPMWAWIGESPATVFSY
jgi:predicted peroxiredoxin